MDILVALSGLGLAAAIVGLGLGAIDVHERVGRLRRFAKPDVTPPLEPFQQTPREMVQSVRSGRDLFGTSGLSADRSLKMLNALRDTQERQADELRELADRIAGMAGVTDRPWRLWLAFGLVAAGTLLSEAADIVAAVGS